MLRLLVVDDEPLIANTIAAISRHYGYDSRAAFSGEEALDLTKEFAPDVLLTDFHMPGMNGLELCKKVARKFPGCRRFLLTALIDVPQRGATDIAPTLLAKPIPPRELMGALEQPELGIVSTSAHVLVVDDVPERLYSISRYLRHQGVVVLEATSGKEAVDILRGCVPELILLDVNLPDMDGFEVCRTIRTMADCKDVPVIHLTATYRDSEAEEASQLAGANEYIEQPIEPDLLVARIRDWIQKAYALRA